jgi:hypothetical protein
MCAKQVRRPARAARTARFMAAVVLPTRGCPPYNAMV